MAEKPSNRENAVTMLLLLPGLAGFFGLFFYPMLVTLARGFRPEGEPVGWTLENYAALFRDPDFSRVILLTFFLSITSTVLSIALAVPLALLLRRKPIGHRLLRMTILVPITVPGLIGALGLLLFWGSRGWFNLLLMPLLGRTDPIQVNYTLTGLVIFYVWHYFSYTATTTLSTLEGLDPAFEEAAT